MSLRHQHTDYLIIGQGICGTLLSYYLQQAGQSVIVIDKPDQHTASKVASGIINPVTGKKWVTTWLADKLLPFSNDAYRTIGAQLNADLIEEYELFSYHPTSESQQLFEARIEEDDRWLYVVNNENPWEDFFHFHFGIGAVNPCYVVDVQLLLSKWKDQLLASNSLLEDEFSWADCKLIEEGIAYKDVIAKKLICCDGAAGDTNPYFNRLPFQLNKGEAIIASIPGLPRTHIYKHGVLNMVPWKDDLFWIGSVFDREYKDELPTSAFHKMVEETLSRWLKLPYQIIDHTAALRPATGGQKPFVGLHPVHPSIGIFNGMGSKGCSMAPYLAKEFVDHLVKGTQITPDADINRFAKILSRNT